MADTDGEDYQHGQDQTGDGRQELGDGGYGSIEEAPRPPAGEGAQYEPQQQPHDGCYEGHDQGHPGSVKEKGELVPPLVVRPQRVEVTGGERCFVHFPINILNTLHQVGVVGSQLRSQNDYQDEEDYQDRAYNEIGFLHRPSQPLPEGYRFHTAPTSEVRSRGSTSG